MNYNQAVSHCIFRFLSGSHAYGTNHADSDEDYRGVFMAPLHCAFDLFQTSFMGSSSIENQIKGATNDISEGNYVGATERLRKVQEVDQYDLNFSVGTVSKPGADEELQELRKFLKLAAECNPNIVEFLYIDRNITHQTEIWNKIRDNRHMFLSKKARFTFAGYAFAQLKRIKNHRGYLLNPPGAKPKRKDFGLPEDWKIPKDQQRAALSLGTKMLANGVREQIVKEKKYKVKMDTWQAYQKWSKERNARRRETERKYGYDCKHATHLIRLSRMAKEILTEKTVHVFRPDRDELICILNGKWPYERLIEEAERLEEELEELYRSSDLQNKPDYKGIAKLYHEICEDVYGIKLA